MQTGDSCPCPFSLAAPCPCLLSPVCCPSSVPVSVWWEMTANPQKPPGRVSQCSLVASGRPRPGRSLRVWEVKAGAGVCGGEGRGGGGDFQEPRQSTPVGSCHQTHLWKGQTPPRAAARRWAALLGAALGQVPKGDQALQQLASIRAPEASGYRWK